MLEKFIAGMYQGNVEEPDTLLYRYYIKSQHVPWLYYYFLWDFVS